MNDKQPDRLWMGVALFMLVCGGIAHQIDNSTIRSQRIQIERWRSEALLWKKANERSLELASKIMMAKVINVGESRSVIVTNSELTKPVKPDTKNP